MSSNTCVMAGKKDTFGFDIERYKTNLDEEDEFPNDLNVEEEATGRENDDVECMKIKSHAALTFI